MEFLWYFLEIVWYFDGIPVKKAMQKVLLAELNQYFCGIFHIFSHLVIPQKIMEKAQHCRNVIGILMEISLNLLFAKKKANYINEKHYIIIFSWH